MAKFLLLLATIASLSAGPAAYAARPAKPVGFAITRTQPAAIVLPDNATVPETTAAADLQSYIGRITGAQCPVIREGEASPASTRKIYVGATRFAGQHVSGLAAFGDEEWTIRTQAANLILTGGAPRGALYATYRFLEEICGVHWWNSFEETVPTRNTLTVKSLDLRGKPGFYYRDIYSTYSYDGGRFASRNRLNRQGFDVMDIKHGGSRTIGPPDWVHTFFSYMPPEKYYQQHPDWFLIDPSRTFMGQGPAHIYNAQLNLGHAGMRAEFLRLLLENIRKSRQAAFEKGQTPPDIFDVSQNDGGVSWVGPEDKALVEREGTNAASMIVFLNYLADGIREEFPNVYLSTLAYHSGEKAPKTIRPRDNVIVRLTDTRSNYLLPVTHPRNEILRKNVEDWAKLTKNLYIWDYNVTFVHPEFPTPTLHTYAPDLKFFRDHNVTGYLTEFEYPIEADLRDLKVWVLCKLLENPDRPTAALVKQFTDGYYGKAGPFVRQYMQLLEKAAEKKDAGGATADITWFAGTGQFTYLTVDFLRQANAIFDRAAQAVGNDQLLTRRVRHARLAVDSAILKRYPRLAAAWARAGQGSAKLPFDRELIARRYQQTWNEQVDMRPKELGREKAKAEVAEEVRNLTTGSSTVTIPEKFRGLPPADVYIYGSTDTRYAGPDPLGVRSNGLVVLDEGATNGIARRFVIPEDQTEKYKLPMAWGAYANREEKTLITQEVKPEQVPGPGYNWYRLGTVRPTPSTYVFLTWSWWMQTDIGGDVDPNQDYEVWGHLKFEGPLFPHGKAEDKNAIVLDQYVLVRQPPKSGAP